MPCPCLGSVSGQCAELLGALSGILVSFGHDLFAAVGADDGRVTAQACGGAREMIATARTNHLDLGFVLQRVFRHRLASAGAAFAVEIQAGRSTQTSSGSLFLQQ